MHQKLTTDPILILLYNLKQALHAGNLDKSNIFSKIIKRFYQKTKLFRKIGFQKRRKRHYKCRGSLKNTKNGGRQKSIKYCQAIQLLRNKTKTTHSNNPSFCWEGTIFSPKFWKGIDQIKTSAWEDLMSSCHRYLPGGTSYVTCQKILKYAADGFILNVNLSLF